MSIHISTNTKTLDSMYPGRSMRTCSWQTSVGIQDIHCSILYIIYIYIHGCIYIIIYNQYLSDNQRLCVKISGPSTPIYASHQYPSVMLSPARRVIFFLAKISARGSLSIKPIFHGLFCQFYQVLQHRSSHK